MLCQDMQSADFYRKSDPSLTKDERRMIAVFRPPSKIWDRNCGGRHLVYHRARKGSRPDVCDQITALRSAQCYGKMTRTLVPFSSHHAIRRDHWSRMILSQVVHLAAQSLST